MSLFKSHFHPELKKRGLLSSLLGSILLVTAPSVFAESKGDAASANPFMVDAATITKRCDDYIGKLKTDLVIITSSREAATFDSVARPFDAMTNDFFNGFFTDYLMKNAHPDTDVRKASDDCTQNAMAIWTKLSLNRPLFERFAAIDTSNSPSEEAYMINYWLTQLKIGGIDRDEETRKKVEEINNAITDISNQFNKNITEDVRSITVASNRLKGLPKDFIDNHPADDKGMVTITTSYSDIGPVFKYAEDDKLRQDLMMVFNNRAYPKNEKILKAMLIKRYELAKLLGHDNFAQLAMQGTMMKSPDRAGKFIASLNTAIKEPVKVEKNRLLSRVRKDEPNARAVNAWQSSYLSNLIRQEEYALDAKEVREYFRYDKVRDGILKLSEDMFTLDIREWDTPTWHEDVEAYQVFENDALIGQFYFDSHPREGKYTHAAQFGVKFGVKGKQVPAGALMMNFPTGLMEHNQVETFLHEFGHLLHYIFAGQSDIGFRRFMSEDDFGEAPSGMLEEWVWDYETLSNFATNEAGEVIPKALVKKMNNARSFGQAMSTARQLKFTALSLSLYDRDPTDLSISKLDEEIAMKYSPFGHVDGTHQYASFGHLAGYSSNYYTYQWSNAIAEELLSRFKKEGLRNKKTANDYR
ncbi:MAG: tetraacyldisaccharide 4'-kinase, partial [Gammaproteobacteria bacterium]